MTVALSGNFLVNARSLTFTDTASVTWAFNTQTNSLTATSSGGGGGSSANPSATIGLTAVNGSAGTFMTSDSAPPLSQAITPTWTNLHTFTGGVTITSGGTLTIDLYTLSLTANASLGGTNTGDQVIPTGANPSGTIGLTANNGSASTFMRSDATPALGVGIAPTWTGVHTFTPSSGSAQAIVINAPSTASAVIINGAAGYNMLDLRGDTAGVTWRNSTPTTYLQIGTVEFWTGGGTDVTDAAIGSAKAMNFYSGNGTTATIGLGTSANTLGFYGMTPAAQTASNSSMITSNVSSVLSTVATASSTALTTAVNATINAHGSAIIQNGKMLQQVINVLQAIGIYATH